MVPGAEFDALPGTIQDLTFNLFSILAISIVSQRPILDNSRITALDRGPGTESAVGFSRLSPRGRRTGLPGAVARSGAN